ncbi:ABC transporter permease [Telmatobacter bradus]|uniref:ABC transporter permease n=1 Tax=Telmatobacter bradus TaxID=474953 RepID=UPI003B42F0DB
MGRALGWKRAAAIGWRDLKSAPAKFGFVVLSVAVGVAALVGVRGLSESFKATLSGEARSILAGDLSARLFRGPSADEQKKLDALAQAHPGLRSTWVVETFSMASGKAGSLPLLVTLKAVDPAEYPYYGEAKLEPAISLREALRGDSVVVAEEFLIRTHAQVGDQIQLGMKSFRIAAVVREEPDRMTAGAGMGPRVFLATAQLEGTGLMGFGARASHRLLVKLPTVEEKQAEAEAATVRKELEATLPEAQVVDYREGNPALTHGLENATAILSLICLVAMVLGAIGVAMAMHAHLEQRMDMLAILKAMGASTSDLLRIFLLQTLGLGLAGGLLGAVAGLAVMMALPHAFGSLIPLHIFLQFPWRSVLAGLGTGLLTTLLFCLPPLLDVRKVRPILVLRRLVEQGPVGLRGWLGRWWERRLQLGLAALVLAVLGGIAWVLADSPKVGASFALFFSLALLVLLAMAAGALRVLRFVLDRVRLHLPTSVRHGLANLYRPGNQSAAVLAALGLGVMLILTVYLIQFDLLKDLRETASPKLPNLFLIDVTNQEAAGVKEFFAHQPGVTAPLTLLPVVQGRIDAINGRPVEEFKGQHVPLRELENAELSWSDAVPEGDKLTAGQWWSDANASQIALDNWIAERLHLGVGSALTVEVGGVKHEVKVAALFKPDGQHIGGRVSFLLPSGLLKDQPGICYGGVHVDPRRVGAIEQALFAAYPTVTVINVADVLERVESVVEQISFVIHLLAGFSILAGLMILASSVASTRYHRMREAVVLKTLGATRLHVVRTFSVEFSVLGLLAGLVGAVFANLLTRALEDRLQIPWHAAWSASLWTVLATAALATGTGWLASHRILGLRPLEVLRDE